MWLLSRVIYLCIIFLAGLTGIIVYKRLAKAFKGVLLLLWITLCSETLAVVLAYYHVDNRLIYHLFNPVECVLWGYVYYMLFVAARYKRVTLILCLLATMFMIANSLWLQHFRTSVNFYSIVAENVFLLVISMLYFKQLLENPQEGNILRVSAFWLNCAVLFFYTVNILFWLAYHFLLLYNKTLLNIGFQLDIYSNYVLYLVLGYAFTLERKTRPGKNSGY